MSLHDTLTHSLVHSLTHSLTVAHSFLFTYTTSAMLRFLLLAGIFQWGVWLAFYGHAGDTETRHTALETTNIGILTIVAL